MQENTIVKAQELSFALIKVSGYIRRVGLRQSIENLTYRMLEGVSFGIPEDAYPVLSAIRQFVELGRNLYEIETNNARILTREIDNLIFEVKKAGSTFAELNLDSVFTKKIQINSAIKNKERDMPSEVVIEESEIGNEPLELDKVASTPVYTANERQEKMLSMIKAVENGRLQLKDFIAGFPEVSERTLRYDLKNLCDAGKLVRGGEGGPGSFYTYPQM
jgi:hypothetical protein